MEAFPRKTFNMREIPSWQSMSYLFKINFVPAREMIGCVTCSQESQFLIEELGFLVCPHRPRSVKELNNVRTTIYSSGDCFLKIVHLRPIRYLRGEKIIVSE